MILKLSSQFCEVIFGTEFIKLDRVCKAYVELVVLLALKLIVSLLVLFFSINFLRTKKKRMNFKYYNCIVVLRIKHGVHKVIENKFQTNVE